MTDEESKQESKEEIKEDKPEEKPEDNDDRVSTDKTNLVDEAIKANEEKARLLEEENKLMDRKEKLHAEQMVGGQTEAGQGQEKPKELTDTEYAEALQRGEVNPLKEDGFLK